VAAVARQIGGGGHRNAAGITFHGTLAEAETAIIEALKACLASS
jgi:phosphoesterase RecJ-like protein